VGYSGHLNKHLLDGARADDHKGILNALAHGAYVNATDEIGNSALFLAVEGQDPETIRLLVTHGANVDQENDWDKSPLDLAIMTITDPGTLAFLLSRSQKDHCPYFESAVKSGDQCLIEAFLINQYQFLLNNITLALLRFSKTQQSFRHARHNYLNHAYHQARSNLLKKKTPPGKSVLSTHQRLYTRKQIKHNKTKSVLHTLLDASFYGPYALQDPDITRSNILNFAQLEQIKPSIKRMLTEIRLDHIETYKRTLQAKSPQIAGQPLIKHLQTREIIGK